MNRDLIKAIHAIINKWQKADHIRLCAGELTAQEMMTAKAVLCGMGAEIDLAIYDHEQKEFEAFRESLYE